MAFTAFLRDAGAPVDRLLRRERLPVLCDDPDMFVPLHRTWSFFATVARHEGPALGWWIGEYVGDQNLNSSLLSKLELAPTLFQAFHELQRLSFLEASDVRIGIYERRDDILFTTSYAGMRDVTGYKYSQAYQLGLFIDLIRHFLGRQWMPKKIGIEHCDVPSVAKQQFPGSRILTQQPVGYISVPRNCLHRAASCKNPGPGVAHNPLLTNNWDVIDKLRELLKSYLPDGYPTARFVAEVMDVSERTLARRLSARGLTYGKLVDQVRFEVAKQLLQKPDAQIGEVARYVGFDTQSNFTRMFRRVSGLSPKEFRKANRQ